MEERVPVDDPIRPRDDAGETIRAIILPSYEQRDGFRVDPARVLSFVLRHWILLSAAALIGGGAGLGLSWLFPKVYRAEVILAPVTADQQSGGLQGLLGRYGSLASAVGIDVNNVDSDTAQALALLQSRQFIQQFIVEMDLMKVLYPHDPATEAEEGLLSRKHTVQDAYFRFAKKILLVRQDKATKLVTIWVDWRDRALAAQWANELVRRVNAATRADAIRESEKSLTYLRGEMERADYVKLRESISSVIEAQVNRRMLANTRPDYSFKIIDPAQQADRDKYVSPRRLVFLAVGWLLGFAIGLWIGVVRERRQQRGEASG